MRSPDVTDVERIEGLLRGMPPESEREARLEGLIRELRTLPPAPPLVRERVRPLRPVERKSFSWRPALIALPVALAMIAAAVVFGGRGSSGAGEEAGGGDAAVAFERQREPAQTDSSWSSTPRRTVPGGAALDLAAPGSNRAQEYDVSMELRVPHNDRLSDASADAVRITRDLGGFVVASAVSTRGESGEAQLTVRIPARNVQAAIARLTELGTITAQQVSVQDRQGELDALARRVDSLRVSVADLNARLARGGLTEAERLRLELRRARVRGLLNRYTSERRAVSREVALAEFSLRVWTGNAAAAVPEGRFEGAARDAWRVLSAATAVALFLLIVLSPLLAAAAIAWYARRAYRRRADERLLAEPRPAAARD